MNLARRLVAAAAIAALFSCTAPGTEIEPRSAPAAEGATPPELWNFETAAKSLPKESCGENKSSDQGFVPLDLTVTPLTAKQTDAIAERLPAKASLAGAWELASTDPNFGGLSGLAVIDDTSLLAATDAGGWVRLGLEAGAPKTASIGYMRGADDRFLSGKDEADAEGLAFRDGVAFVSFERNFRIEAFAVGRCGAAAKSVSVAALPGEYEGRVIPENEGPEALRLTADGALDFGFEGISNGVSPLGHVLAAGRAAWTGKTAANPSGFALVSMDSVRLPGGAERDVYLYRAFDPLRGARSVVSWGPGEADRLTLSRPVQTDNFEGMAAEITKAGKIRIWIISDNNFSSMQQNLIYAFDITS